ncbi:MAG: hypothetical protein EPO28_06295 [Saprospiraceae bacterium]|nr:MAG: hypothetical protein EPO28_06295 [Saprospiraceae bacterium]
MKKSTWIIAFLALTFAGDRLGGWALGTIIRDGQFRYSKLYRPEAGCDILFAGSSRGLIFYQPYIEAKTGLTTCNLSYNGLPLEMAAALLKDHLDRHTPPKVLLIEVTMLDKRMNENLTANFNLYAPYSERLSVLLKEKFPKVYYGGEVSHLYRYNGEVFQRALYYWKRPDKDWLLDRVISPTMIANVTNQPVFNFDYTDEMLVQLADVVAYAKAKGVHVELVVNPYYPPFAATIGNLDVLTAAIEKATGIPVRNYATSVTDQEGFGDYQHLNKRGSRLFIDKLLEDEVLPALEKKE